MQIDRCDQLTHYLAKIQGPSAASAAAGNGASAEVASIDGYKVGNGIPHEAPMLAWRAALFR